MGKSHDVEKAHAFIENLYYLTDSYSDKANVLESNYEKYVRNDKFVGKAADASKAFISDKQLKYHYEQKKIQSKLCRMYSDIEEEFKAEVDASPKARIDTDVLTGIKREVEDFFDNLSYNGRGIENDAAYVNELAKEYSDLCEFSFTQPDYDPTRQAYGQLCGTGEFIDTCIKKFERFDQNSWDYVNRTGIEEYVYELTTDINAKADRLNEMEVYEPQMEKTLIKAISQGGIKAIKEIDPHDIYKQGGNKERLEQMEKGAKILSAMGDYLGPKLKEAGKALVDLQPDNRYYNNLTSMGLFSFFEFAGGIQSLMETGSLADTEKNAKKNFRAFQRGGVSVAVETVTGFLKLPELGFKAGHGISGMIEEGVDYIKEKGTDNLPADLMAWFGDKKDQGMAIVNILKDEAIQKTKNMSVEEGYEAAGYILTTIGSFVVGGGEAGGASKAGEAGEAVVNSLDDFERVVGKLDDAERVIETAAGKGDDLVKLLDKGDDIAKATGMADDAAKAGDAANLIIKKTDDVAEVVAETSDDVAKATNAADDAVLKSGKETLSGEWKKVNENMSDFSRAYQTQITGEEGAAWVQNGVKFDGMKDGILLDAKGKYSQFINESTGEFYEWFSGKQSLINEAKRQIVASEGAKIQWYFAEEETLNVVQDLFMDNGITGIELIFEAAD
ncbi:hypothetical protein D6856_12595 [Butyrivibrio sp. XB500-5]|uniref:Tox-REase-5 domain-containing protein n=1 Tax=Butyrivibrio sp. XB500-5 TaxID=2364880 RepID=UPI000EA8C194|nr:Tox-REase-5 domain-containing protein [Butyrivibrio sp. XB500-5]RKM58586.1 hypothetical protein D6856_12595 [Butyrivibrio sp. XB500-5]